MAANGPRSIEVDGRKRIQKQRLDITRNGENRTQRGQKKVAGKVIEKATKKTLSITPRKVPIDGVTSGGFR
jgi:hypothetical protein